MRLCFPRWAALTAATALSLASMLPQGVAAESGIDTLCNFQLGFGTMVDALSPDLVGACVGNEYFNMYNGNSEQRTRNGLLYWRKSDNTTAFTDGSSTWLNGAYGIQVRLNSDTPFEWEHVGILLSAAEPIYAIPPAIVQAPSPAPVAPAVPALAIDRTMTTAPLTITAPRNPEITTLIVDEGPANLRNADLTNADRRGLQLVNADLYRAKLVGTDFSYAKLAGASMIGAEVTRGVFFGADLTQVRAMGAFARSSAAIPGPNFGKAAMNRCRFSFANIPYSDFRQADMSSCDFSNANLTGSDMRGAMLHCADLSNAHLEKVDLSGADVLGAKLPALGPSVNTAGMKNVGVRDSSCSSG